MASRWGAPFFSWPSWRGSSSPAAIGTVANNDIEKITKAQPLKG